MGGGRETGYPVGARSVLLSPGRLERRRAFNGQKAGAAVRPTGSRFIRPMPLGLGPCEIDRRTMGTVPMGS